MYWIYDESGNAKKYTEASAEETTAFLLSLTKTVESEEESQGSLALLPIKAIALDFVLTQQCIIYAKLLFSPSLQRDEFFKLRNKQDKKKDD